MRNEMRALARRLRVWAMIRGTPLRGTNDGGAGALEGQTARLRLSIANGLARVKKTNCLT